MNKVPCGGFELDKNFLGMNKNGELSLIGGGSEGNEFKQLVTDGNGEAKWEDRLAYDNKTVFVEQTEITNAGRESIIDLSLLANGSFVTVNIDGTEYNATLEEGGEYMLGTGAVNCYYHIGGSGGINISSKTTFTSGYPFFVVIDEDGECMVLFDGESVGTKHTFGVYAGEIKQIDSKYIPSNIAYVNMTSSSTSDGLLITADKTVDEIAEFVKQGKHVISVITPNGQNGTVIYAPLVNCSLEEKIFQFIAIMSSEDTALITSIHMSESDVSTYVLRLQGSSTT